MTVGVGEGVNVTVGVNVAVGTGVLATDSAVVVSAATTAVFSEVVSSFDSTVAVTVGIGVRVAVEVGLGVGVWVGVEVRSNREDARALLGSNVEHARVNIDTSARSTHPRAKDGLIRRFLSPVSPVILVLGGLLRIQYSQQLVTVSSVQATG